MLPINIDISEVVDEFTLTAGQSQALGESIIDNIVAEYTSVWNKEVENNLHSTRQIYKRAMVVLRKSPTEAEFVLSYQDSPLVKMLEDGSPPFDQKPFFKKSPKVKRKIGGGWYLTIPFRHATSSAVAESSVFSSVLPKEIQQIAKDKSPRALKKSDLPEQYQKLGVRPGVVLNGIVMPEYQHKSAQYEGLVRVNVSSTKKENRGGYFTFRRVSDKSASNSWIYGGMTALKLMDKALVRADISNVAERAINDFLKNIS